MPFLKSSSDPGSDTVRVQPCIMIKLYCCVIPVSKYLYQISLNFLVLPCSLLVELATQWNITVSVDSALLQFRVGQGGGGGGSGIPVYPKKIRQNTPQYPKFIQIYPKLIEGILYTWNSKKVIYPYLSCNIPYTRFKKPLYTVYPKTLADPDNLFSTWVLDCYL